MTMDLGTGQMQEVNEKQFNSCKKKNGKKKRKKEDCWKFCEYSFVNLSSRTENDPVGRTQKLNWPSTLPWEGIKILFKEGGKERKKLSSRIMEITMNKLQGLATG